MPLYIFKEDDNDTKNSDQKNKTDILQATVGDFGKWQLKISVLMALLKFPIAWFQLSIVFLAPTVQFSCKTLQNFKENNSTIFVYDNNLSYNKSIQCVHGYNYNRTVFSSTIVTEWDLVFGNKRLVDVSQITLMLGVLVGNIFFGVMSDRRGRKTALITCILLQSIFGIISSWIPWFWGFVFTRFLLGFANGGTIVTSFVMCLEIVGGKWRTIVPILYQIPFGLGNTIMALISYWLRDWRQFHFTLSILSSLYLVYFWLIPESPRWLLAVGRKTSAVSTLRKAAVINNKDLTKIEDIMKDLSNLKPVTNESSVLALFSTPELRKRSILLYITWIISGVTFYAFSQYLGHVSRNIFLTVAVGGLISIPGTMLCVILVGRCGRKYTIVYSQLSTALCFVFIICVPKGYFHEDWPRVVFASLGIIGLSVSMPALYLFTGELFPTVLRNAGVGTSVMFLRVGSMVASLIIALQEIAPYLPLLILGAVAFLEVFLVLPLPETKGKVLPEKICDLEEK